MTWTIEFTKKAQKQLISLDNKAQKRIKKAILEKLVKTPQKHLTALHGDKAGFYKFRVGDYRLLCSKEDTTYYILIVKVKYRKEVYTR